MLEFAPLRIPLSRRLQTLWVLYFCFEFIFLGFFSVFLLIYVLLCTKYYWLTLAYLAWFIYDRNVCFRGGRRIEWFRNLSTWKYYANYFPIKLVKTADLNPEKNYIFGLHPHGLLCCSHFANFATEGTGFSKLFPGIRSHLMALNYMCWQPFHREFFIALGGCAVAKESIEYILSQKGKGNVAAIVVGGALEVLDTIPNKLSLTLKKRKGFVKIALKHGASLVPVISFGENDLYKTKFEEGSEYNKKQERLIKMLGVPLPFFAISGRGIFQYTFGILPFRKPLTSVVGKPIDTEKTPNPTQEQIDKLHQQYMEAVERLFYENKDKYGATNVEFKIK